jgi:hypothetical protein
MGTLGPFSFVRGNPDSSKVPNFFAPNFSAMAFIWQKDFGQKNEDGP